MTVIILMDYKTKDTNLFYWNKYLNDSHCRLYRDVQEE